ncbi:hypothetical protein IQ260_02890 [Leptolyngbya cf. ectocarpi LEGE 11479]|uniref:Uncharacterized protein n=1 Tax=Leptolyngbya cf. ectocarpi LEGE 11479 TaxID=1828722 RepID=A0A928ZS44_LEPEC|nr:hypothetical protein [Leptolyngbya ectocarpi]MBE9065592.1 hypothetical protein [Leptolyngbya cf. ectocarpi LEGE 11479]
MSISNPQSVPSVNLPNTEQILGLAIFDARGLPRDYFITLEHDDTEWIQLVFQALGLQQLLTSEMELPKLDNVVIRTKVGNIVVIRAEQGYIALLIKRLLPQERPHIDRHWVDWILNFEATVVRTNPNFKVV